MLGRALPAIGRSNLFTSRVVQAQVQSRILSRSCSQCRSVRDWKENHAAWSRYSISQSQHRACSQCRSVKDWKENHAIWSRLNNGAAGQLKGSSAAFSTSPLSPKSKKKNRDVNQRDPVFEGKQQPAANTEPTKQPGPGKPPGKASLGETPEVPDSLKNTGGNASKNTAPKEQPGPGKPLSKDKPDKTPETLDSSKEMGADASQSAEPEEQPGPLPDLSQGIPSTIARELEQAERARRGESEEGATADSDAPRGRRPRSAQDTETSGEKKRNQYVRYFSLVGATGALGFLAYQGRDWATQEEADKHTDAPSGWSPVNFYKRLIARWSSTTDYYTEPAFQKLLPEPDPTWAREYTLVLSLEDLLIHQEWSREHGWRLAKRPGVDYFLRYLSQYYELVIFTTIPSMNADPIIRKLDPYRIIMWPLFREATKYKNGEYIKDLSYLNRDLSKTVLLDTDPSHARLQPENAIILPKWKGQPDDRELVSFIPFLEYVAALQHPDIRKAISSFDGKHIPTEFAQREEAARQKFLAEEAAKGKTSKSGLGGLATAFGVKSDGVRPDGFEGVSEGLRKGKMLHDQIRERGQMAYMELEKQIRENGEKWLKEMAEEEEKAKAEAMKSMTSGVTGFFGGSSNKSDEKK